MADSDARTGYGALLQKGDGATPENFISILGVKSMSGPSISRDVQDVTSMTSGDGWREFIGGLNDGGEVSFEANWLPRDPTQSQEQDTGGDTGFMGEFDKDSCASRGNWRILVPACPGEDEVSLTFAGIVTGQNIEIPMDDVMSFQGTIKVSGRPELVVETGA